MTTIYYPHWDAEVNPMDVVRQGKLLQKALKHPAPQPTIVYGLLGSIADYLELNLFILEALSEGGKPTNER